MEFPKLAFLVVSLTVGGCTMFSPTPAEKPHRTETPNAVKVTNTTFPQIPQSTPTPLEATETMVAPVSTLPAFEAKDELMRLLATNNCEFPCLWGISPGIATINDVRNLSRYSFFSGRYVNFSENGGHLFLRIPQTNDLLINVNLEIDIVDDIVDEMTFVTQLVRQTDNGYKDVFGEQDYSDATKGYSISNVLTQYGPPSNVNIYTWQTVPMGDSWDFHILLFYPRNGFAVDYVTAVNKISGNNILGCPAITFFSFWFWDSSKKAVTFQSVLEKYHLQNSKQIETASALSVQEFYTLFKKSENDNCIETPRDIWPFP